jgi:hypothetical protein
MHRLPRGNSSEANPDWKRPQDIGLMDMLVTLYGKEKAAKGRS